MPPSQTSPPHRLVSPPSLELCAFLIKTDCSSGTECVCLRLHKLFWCFDLKRVHFNKAFGSLWLVASGSSKAGCDVSLMKDVVKARWEWGEEREPLRAKGGCVGRVFTDWKLPKIVSSNQAAIGTRFLWESPPEAKDSSYSTLQETLVPSAPWYSNSALLLWKITLQIWNVIILLKGTILFWNPPSPHHFPPFRTNFPIRTH